MITDAVTPSRPRHSGATRSRVLAGAGAAAAALLCAVPAIAAGPTTVVSTPSQPNGWALGGSALLATAPPPGGLQAAAVYVESEVATSGRGFVVTETAPVAGTRLADLTAVDYQVNVKAYPPASQFLTGTAFLWLALDGNPANAGDAQPGQPNNVVIAYEPCYALPSNCTGTIQPVGVWTNWSATPGSPAWWPANDIAPNDAATIYSTLDAVVLAAFPNAVITRLRVQIGQGGAGAPWEGWSGYLDGVRFQAGGSTPVDVLVDFEADPVPPPPTPTPAPTPAPTPSALPAQPPLPDTGAPASTLPVAAAGLVLVAFGAVLVAGAARARRRHL